VLKLGGCTSPINDVVSMPCAVADAAGNEVMAVCGVTVLPSFCNDTCCIYNHYHTHHQLDRNAHTEHIKGKGKEGYKQFVNFTSPLQEITYHMRSHSVTCHPAEVTFPPLPQPKLVPNLVTPKGCKAEFSWVVVTSSK